jgi:hypothetical protein
MRLFIVIMLVSMTTFIILPTQEQLNAQREHLAIVVVPVADLMGQPFGHLHNEKSYNSIALCGKKGSFACPRINQLLFHEIVTIIGHQHDEIHIKIPHMFFETAQSSTKIDSYWTLKKNVIPLSKLHDMGVDIQKLPHPISYHSPANQTDQTIAVLTQPYYDPLTRIHFSAGTRFVVDKPQRSPQFIMVWAYHPRKYTIHKMGLPVTSVTIINPTISHDEQRKLMVQTARQWARTNKKGFIPYVWGGCSFSNVCTDPMISEQHGRDIFNAPITFYTRALYSSGPFSGFDCAGLIIRAAQAAGIPYFYKNTTTLEKYLKPITTINDLKTGDIIWLPGHVMMVADLKNNTLIEARGYGDGYGKVHEITLKSLFNHINTYADLINAYNEKKSLERLNSKGGIANTVKNFKILSLESVWNQRF